MPEQGPPPQPSEPDPHLPGPMPEMWHTQELAEKANELLSRGGQVLGPHPTEAEISDRDYEVRGAIAHAEALLKTPELHKKAPGVARAAAAEVDPTSVEERRGLERAAMIDELTKLPNDRAFLRALPAAEADPNTAIIEFDANNFKPINDQISHPAGDAALIALAQVVEAAAQEYNENRVFRPGAGNSEPHIEVFRHGGDEFYVLAPPGIAHNIITTAQRLLNERIASGRPFVDSQGNEYPAELFGRNGLDLSLSGGFGNTAAEADIHMRANKHEDKDIRDHIRTEQGLDPLPERES